MAATDRVKVLGICGSARHASTEWAVKLALSTAESLGYVDTDFVNLGEYKLTPCTGCMKCFGWQHPADAPLPKCYESEDDTEKLFEKFLASDGVILGTPSYVLGVTSLTRIFMEKAHQMGPMSFTKFAGWMRHKPIGAITVGGVDIAGQESIAGDIWIWAIGLGMLPVGSWPTFDDPNPQASEHGGLVSTVDGRAIYGKDALSRDACRTVPPTQGIRNERALRNVGRHVAHVALVSRLGVRAVKDGDYQVPRPISFTRYSVKAKKNSWVQKLMDEGVIKYVPKTEVAGELNPWEE